jgi:2-polyprenyl-6-hydroxyphenyl methylase/3-demethylubiquinone-9 3-methyltransferase
VSIDPQHDSALSPPDDAHRFGFGENWLTYAAGADERSVAQAEQALTGLLGLHDLRSKRFLDAGCGSGIFSLAARRLGAVVYSFDFDPMSVQCTEALKQQYRPDDREWTIERGSVLDEQYLGSLGQFDIVYSWGVLHHTGAMWQAVDNIVRLVGRGGMLCIALYNDQGIQSRIWTTVKKTYNRLPPRWRFVVFVPALVRLWLPTLIKDALRGRPFHSWRAYGSVRGMSPLVDARDWVGGYPFEVANPQEVVAFCRRRGLVLTKSIMRSGIGCNEFVFKPDSTGQ